MKLMTKPTLSTIAAFLMMSSINAHAGLFDDKEARKSIVELTDQLHAAQRTIDSQANQITELNQALAKLRGQQEQMQNDLRQVQADQKGTYESLDARLAKLEPVSDEQKAQGDFDAAMALVEKNNFTAAYGALDRFVKKYPNNANATLAEYWRGTSAYATSNFKNAIIILTGFIQKNPAHEKKADALLTLGSAYIDSGKKPEGQAILNKLITEFPNSNAAKTAASLNKK